MGSDNLSRMEDALVRAHEAGDPEAAQVIAEEIRRARSAAPAPAGSPNAIQRLNKTVSDASPDIVRDVVDVAAQPASGVLEGGVRTLLAPIDIGKSLDKLPDVLQSNLSRLIRKFLPADATPEQIEAADTTARVSVLSNPAMLSLAVGRKLQKKLGLPEPAGYDDFRKAMLDAGVTAPEPTDTFGRITRRAGEEVGASAVPTAAVLRAASKPTAAVNAGPGVVQQAVASARKDPTGFVKQDIKLAAAGGAGAGIAREIAPESSAAEMFGLLTGTLAPAALEGTVRRIVRGGEGTRQTMAKTVNEFAAAGVTPTVGMATRRRFNEAFESGLAILPGSSGRMAIYAEKTARKLYDQVDGITAGIAPIRSPDTAGRAVQKGIEGFVRRFKDKWRAMDAAVAKHVEPTAAVVVPETRAAVTEMMDPVTTAAFPQLSALAQRLDAISKTGAVAYKDLRLFRSSVGSLIPDSYAAQLPEGVLKKLYGAMTRDLRAHVASSPEALKAFDRSSKYYQAAMTRLDESLRPLTASDIPERVFAALERSGAAGPTVINAAKRSIGRENWDIVAGTILQRMGLAKAGAQSADADVFSVDTFLTNWNKYGRNPGTINALLSGTSGGARFVRDMNAVARVTERFREAGRVFANPSGTARAIANIGLGTSVASSALGGQWGIMARILAIASGANMTARAFTNPKFVHFLAQTTRVPAARVPNLIARLGSQMASEPEAVQAEVAAFLDRFSDEFSLQSAQEQEVKGAKTRQ